MEPVAVSRMRKRKRVVGVDEAGLQLLPHRRGAPSVAAPASVPVPFNLEERLVRDRSQVSQCGRPSMPEKSARWELESVRHPQRPQGLLEGEFDRHLEFRERHRRSPAAEVAVQPASFSPVRLASNPARPSRSRGSRTTIAIRLPRRAARELQPVVLAVEKVRRIVQNDARMIEPGRLWKSAGLVICSRKGRAHSP